MADGRLTCLLNAARADSELSDVLSCSNDLILSSNIFIRAVAYDKNEKPSKPALNPDVLLQTRQHMVLNYNNTLPSRALNARSHLCNKYHASCLNKETFYSCQRDTQSRNEIARSTHQCLTQPSAVQESRDLHLRYAQTITQQTRRLTSGIRKL